MSNIRERVRRANAFLTTVATCGRQLFRREDEISRFALDGRHRVYFVDKYSQHSLPTFGRTDTAAWQRYFTEGGTLKALVLSIAKNYIAKGEKIEPWRLWREADGDPWAYGPDMKHVRESAWALGIWTAETRSEEFVAEQMAEPVSAESGASS